MLKKLTMQFATMTAFALVTLAPGLTAAQTTESGQHRHDTMHGRMCGASNGAEGVSESMMDCQQMMQKKREMQAKQQKMQAELDELVAQMNGSDGTDQQEVMAELLTKLVEQRGSMQHMMMKMQPMMMQHMMSGQQGAMAGCPMMQKMHGEKSSESASGGEGDQPKQD